MAKVTITNLDQLVNDNINGIVTSNVNVVGAQQAVVDAETYKDIAADKASEASASAGIASLSADSAAQSMLDTRDEALRAEAAVISAENQVTLAETKAAEALDSAALAESARTVAEQHRDTSLDVLAQVEQVYDNFDDRYLGGHSSDPVTDNDGDDIVDGALYWNTTEKALKLYNQTALAWQSISESSGALLAVRNLSDIIDTNEARDNLDVYAKGETNSILQLDARDVNNRNTDNHIDGTANGVYTLAERTKLAGVEGGATADQTGAEIKSLYEAESNTNAYTDNEKVLVDVGTPLDTTSATLPGAVNEVHGEVDTHVAATSAHGVTTVAGLNEVQTLTNKTLDDYTNKVKANAVHMRVKNQSGVVMPKGTVVAYFGYSDSEDAVKVVKANNTTGVAIGILAEELAADEFGMAIANGIVDGLDTSAYVNGTILYTDIAGGLTSVEPTTGFAQPIAYVLKSNATIGVLQVLAAYPKQDAGDVRVAPQGNLSSNTVQLALNELQSNIDSLTTDVEW
jgi:hypothetical protein